MKLRTRILLGLLLVTAGLLMGYQPYVEYKQSHLQPASIGTAPVSQPAAAQTAPPDNQPAPLIQGKPVRIQVPRLKIDLVVIDGYYNAQSKAWTLSNDKAQYAVMTPQANNKEGNTFIYGHAVQRVFGRLPQIKPGDTVIVTTDNGKTFTYKFRSAYETNPNDDSLFRYTGPAILTLQTCSGTWYQNRMLFTFDLDGVA